MSELEELPSWAGRSTDGSQPDRSDRPDQGRLLDQAAQPAPVVESREPRRRRPWMIALLALFGILALLGMGALGYLLASSQDEGTETATAGNETDDAAADGQAEAGQLGSEELAGEDDASNQTDDDAVTVAVEEETDADATDDATDEATDDSASDDADDAATADTDADAESADGSESDRQAIFRGGKVYLSGSVPSEEIGQFIEQKAAAVVGPDNVVNEYTIDPAAVIEEGSSAPLYVEDVVLFEFNSVEIASPFLPILDLGTLLLRQNPQASVTVVTRTDAVGSEEVNLEVSTKRAQAVINYWLSKGVDRDQINADPRGEEGASEDDDEETAALSRRAEFIIIGLLD